MTTWQLRADWEGIRYAVQHAGTAFDVAQEGSVLTVTGADRAVPGSDETVVVSVTSHPAVAPARLILRVGAAPSTLPQGGSVVQQCSQAAGASCTITVVGASGEINPLPRTPLELVGVRATGACTGVGFQVVSATSIAATWTTDAPGATCTASFSVRDAQGRITRSERDGRLVLDLLGYPRTPASVVQTAYGDGTLTLRVDPGEARLAYPGLSGFVVRAAGQEAVRCSADGVCPPIAAPNGERRTYDAWAVNAVGESRGSVRTVAWAYDAPLRPAGVTAAPVVTGDGAGGVVRLVVDGIDAAETGSLEIASPAGEVVRVPVAPGETRVEVTSYRVGSNTSSPVTVTPFSRFDVPPGLGGSAAGEAVTVPANGVGSPLSPQLTLTSVSNGDGTSTVTARAGATVNGDGSRLRYGIVPEGRGCTVTEEGGTVTFPGLADGEEYAFRMCAESWWDGASFGRVEATGTVRAQQSGRAPEGWTFVVDGRPEVSAQRAEWLIREQPTSTERLPNRKPGRVPGLGPGHRGVRRGSGHPGAVRPRVLGHRDGVVDGEPARGERPLSGAGDVARRLVRRRDAAGRERAVLQRPRRLTGGVHVRQRRAALLRRCGSSARPRGRHLERPPRRRARRRRVRHRRLGRPGLGSGAGERDLLGLVPAEPPRPARALNPGIRFPPPRRAHTKDTT